MPYNENYGDFEDDDPFSDSDDIEVPAEPQIPRKYLPQRTIDGLVAPISAQETQENTRPASRSGPIVKKHHVYDKEALKTYIYPSNFEIRDYQYNIVRHAFFHNLLVALPTGLGKTFIASTVMLNFFRWFPESKIVFMAPTKPLVAQQIRSCCSATGLPASSVAILLDKTRRNRREIWDQKQVFFTTPQVVENDLASGIVDPKTVSLLVIDEAHRSRGNYSYSNVAKFLKRFNRSFRILALTATPASAVEGVQEIVDNLGISKIEVRTENSIDIVKHMKRKKIERRTCGPSPEILECIDLLCTAIEPALKVANQRKIYDITDPLKINFFHCMEASRRITMDKSMPEGLKWSNFFVLQLLGVVGQCFKRLHIYGLRSFFTYFHEKYSAFKAMKKSKNKLAIEFYNGPAITTLIERAQQFLQDPKLYSHPKIEALMEELSDFFESNTAGDSKVIIFSEFRDSALEIVQSIEKANLPQLKPHIFIGQAKEKEKFDIENPKKKSKKGKKEKKEEDSSDRTSSEDAQLKGMNQKLQKEIIKQFKNGTYNILVATSIGEEGLDIGEVDLIICYDSTSSPIKNIQRMGRTGRKRDGKVVLLFSSNEESKFDKAMAGYEYIQQHIMKGELITLADQNRILPSQYDPQVVEKFIEVPDENLELEAVDDEDEIIRIATQYMKGKETKGAKSKKSTSKKAEKHEKRFFMPDYVNTGFQSVTSMLQSAQTKPKNTVDKPQDTIDKHKDTLDSILSSDSSEPDKLNEPDSDNFISSDEEIDFGLEKKRSQPEEHPVIDTAVPRLKRGTLGLKKPRINGLQQQRNPEPKVKPGLIIDDDIEIPAYTVAKEQEKKDDTSNDEIIKKGDGETSDDEYFDDGLDEELAVFHDDQVLKSFTSNTQETSNTQVSNTKDQVSTTQDEMPSTKEKTNKVEEKSNGKEEVYDVDVSSRSGLLNEQEQTELYTAHFTTIDPDLKVSHYDPCDGIHCSPDGERYTSTGRIGHGRTVSGLLKALNRTSNP